MKLRPQLLLLSLAIRTLAAQPSDAGPDTRGRQFVGFDSFDAFAKTPGTHPGETIFTSPEINTRIDFNEGVVSWNAASAQNSYLVVEARALYPRSASKFYTLGLWSTNPARYPRRSVPDQNDADGAVATDVLVLHRPARRLQIRITSGGAETGRPALRFLGISLTDTNVSPPQLPPNRAAWDKLIPVPERTQMIYPNGKTLCSPTTVSMLLGYWAETLKRPDLDRPVPEIASAIYDSQWQGTGNWPFNMAYAGAFPGLRAYVTRLSDVAELEAWIARDIPVGLSVDYDRLRAKGPGPNGHIVACVGFTKDGNPIINDPGTTEHVRKVFPRQNLIDAWACSRNTVYLVYPENAAIPEDRFGHWDSPPARR